MNLFRSGHPKGGPDEEYRVLLRPRVLLAIRLLNL